MAPVRTWTSRELLALLRPSCLFSFLSLSSVVLVVEVVSRPRRCPAVPLFRPPLSPSFLYYSVCAGGSLSPNYNCVGGFLYRCGPPWLKGSRAAPVAPPLVAGSPPFLVGMWNDDSPQAIAARMHTEYTSRALASPSPHVFAAILDKAKL